MKHMTENMKKGISGSTLKLMAMFSMLGDHICAALVEPLALGSGNYDLYRISNSIRLSLGRIAFPIFCFLLVEGFFYTRDRKKYALRLGAFALVSELPFDLAFHSGLEWDYQNVFFTLLIALLVMWGCECLRERYGRRWWSLPVRLGIMLTGVTAADLLKTDYAGYGVVCILCLYCLHSYKRGRLLVTSLVLILGNASELLAPLGFIPAVFYSGKRGLRLKYIFYVFYPLHLLILYGIRCLAEGGYPGIL